MKDSLLNKFKIDKEEFEKSKDILPTLDMGKLEINESVIVTIDSEEPTEIEHDDKFNKGKKIKSLVLPVVVNQYNRIDKENKEFIVTANDEKMTLWLSSKSLRMNLLKCFENKPFIKGVKLKITKTTAVYKNFGENTCYTVVLID